MNGELDNRENDVDVDVEEEEETFASPDETVVLSEDAADLDEVDDATAEVNVEKLVARVESGDIDAAEHKKEVKRRLEEIEERRRTREELDSTYNFNIEEDL